MRFVARLIAQYGDAYWPVFDWLEEELTTRQARKAKLRRYGDRHEATGDASKPVAVNETTCA